MDQNPAAAPKRKLTKRQIVTLIIAGVLAVAGISVAVKMRQEDNAIIKNGVETTAISTGQYLQTREGGRRGSTAYKAQYRFEVDGRADFLYGEKRFKSPDEIVEGKTVTIKYLKDETHKAIVVSEE